MKAKSIFKIVEQLHSANEFINMGDEPEFSVLLPIVEKENELYILFEKRSEYVKQPGEICFPGGKKEAGDQGFEDTALRETMEEIGVPIKDIRVLGKMGSLVNHLRMIVHCYIGYIQWDDLQAGEYNKSEVESLLLINIDRLLEIEPKRYKIKLYADPSEINEKGDRVVLFPASELDMPDIYHQQWHLGYREIVSYDVEKVKIWGLTGKILEYFLRKIDQLV